MTTYALADAPYSLMAVWDAGVGHRTAVVCRLSDAVPPPAAEELSGALTELSQRLWDTYVRLPAPATDPYLDELADQERGKGFTGVLRAVDAPHLPDSQGLLMISYDPVIEAAHAVGRALRAAGDTAAARAVTAEIGVEIDAVLRAELGDLSGRAVQAVSLDRFDVSPVQVAAADQLLSTAPLGAVPLWTTVDAAAACVAAVHWLTAAAQVAAEVAGLEPAQVFGYADDIEAVSIEVPAAVVTMICDERMSPRAVVLGLLGEAAAVRDGRVPDPVAMLQRVDDVRAEMTRLPLEQREHVLAGLLDRLTLLEPLRPARDLLEHLLDGMRACLIVYREDATDHTSLSLVGVTCDDVSDEEFDEDAADEARARLDEAFVAAVRQRSVRERGRLDQ